MERPILATRILHDPPRPADASEARVGAGAHTHRGMLTILLQDEAGGLEVADGRAGRVPAMPVPRAFVVRLGDTIPVLTNDPWRWTRHRVRANITGRSRYFAPISSAPDHRTAIRCASPPACPRPERRPIPRPPSAIMRRRCS
jgi:isopenicillin N synthase-like dioxygenase